MGDYETGLALGKLGLITQLKIWAVRRDEEITKEELIEVLDYIAENINSGRNTFEGI